MLKHTNTYSKADLTDKQLSQEQKHGQQYFLDIRPHTLQIPTLKCDENVNLQFHLRDNNSMQ